MIHHIRMMQGESGDRRRSRPLSNYKADEQPEPTHQKSAVALHILWSGWHVVRDSIDSLMDRTVSADHVVDFKKVDPVQEILRITDGRGVDVAIEALGNQSTFAACLRVLRPGGTLSSLGVYLSDLQIPLAPFAAGLGDHTIVTRLCPWGKERMRRLMAVIASGRIDLKSLVTHRFKLDDIERAYELFANQRDGVLKVAITP